MGRISKLSTTLMMFLLLTACQLGRVESKYTRDHQQKQQMEVTADGEEANHDGEKDQSLGQQQQRQLGRRDRNNLFVNGNGRGYVARQGNRGGSRGKGSSSSSSRSGTGGSGPGGARYYVDDDFFYGDSEDNNYGRRSGGGSGASAGMMMMGESGDGRGFIASGLGRGIILQRPYRGTGIGRIDRRPGMQLPRAARRPGGNSSPPGFRPDMIRPGGPAPSQAPSLSMQPSLRPVITPLPTLPPTSPAVATTAPTTGAATSNDLIVRSTFSLTYFTELATDVVRDLTAEEYTELSTLMDQFYTDAFQADPAFSGTFQNFMTDITTMTYSDAGNPHIFMDFDANYMFAAGSAITVNDVLLKMDGLNYESFITDYLMQPPTNQLDAVRGVEFTASTTVVP